MQSQLSTAEVADLMAWPLRTAKHRAREWHHARQRGDITVPSVTLASGEYRIDRGDLDAWRAGLLGREVRVQPIRLVPPGTVLADQLGCVCQRCQQGERSLVLVDLACPVHGQYFDESPSLDAA